MLDIIVLAVAGLAAGLLNAVAGGGTFLSLPALIWVGVPPVSANATATLTALPGYLSSAWAFRDDMRAQGSVGLRGITLAGMAGSLIGALLLIVTPAEVFMGVVPWLLLAATVLFAGAPRILRAARVAGLGDAGPLATVTALVAVSIYGGYFNGGLGIMLLATFSLLGYADLHGMNGLKNLLSAVLSIVSVVTFITAGLIAWEQAAVMALASLVGGYVGARQSRKIVNTDLLRLFLTGVGAVMTLVFFIA
ncbi:sulfite exporter TauE/SafE family protein [Marinovum sp.]|uniref:sulfite exporter TauE/SafE family protein n=1 Tax=Marinovum sp. TaxID=2024839 RepID=UPI002B26A3BB|nr:sulfite exporter TauE/SafE family protein [Marinovum sp.]